MKKHLLPFALILFLISQTKAQTSVYHPFPDSNAVWCCGSGVCDGTCSFNTAQYQASGNLQIKGSTYIRLAHFEKIITNCNCVPCYCIDGTLPSIDTTTYFIRNDTASKKVWIYNSVTQRDTIFYDFNLHIGDTLNGSKVNWGNSGLPAVISSIDSIVINGQYRTRYNFSLPSVCSPYDSSSLIEGIGSLSGLMYPPGCFEYGASLNEFILNNHFVIGDSTTVLFECPNYSVGINEISNKPFVVLSPNPATNQLTIQTAFHNEAVTVSIMNVLGQTSPPAPLQMEKGAAAIDVSALPSGIYFIQLTTEKERWVGKFVKE